MKILTISAHPDDLELFMGGTISKMLNNKINEIHSIIVTNGAKSPKENSREVNIKIRRKETEDSLEGVKALYFLNVEDGEIFYSNDIIKELDDLLGKIHPDVVFTHNPNDYHSDHFEISNIVKHISSFKVPLVYFDCIIGSIEEPFFYIDITNFISDKEKMLNKHKSQQHLKLFDQVRILNNYRGFSYFGNTDIFAEAFYLGNHFLKFKTIKILEKLSE